MPNRSASAASRIRSLVAPSLACVVACLGAGVLPSSGTGQESRRLTLDDALELASVHNPEYRQALNETELSGAMRRAAWGAFLPDLNLSLGTGLDLNRRLTSTDFFGNPVENPITEWQTTSSSQQSASATVALFEGGRHFHRLAEEKALADVRAGAAAVRFAAVVAQVERQFYETLRQSELLAIAEALLESKRRDLDATERLFRLASTGRVDVLAAELAVQQQARDVRQARSDYEKALLALRTVIAAPDLGTVSVEAPTARTFDPSTLDADPLVERALRENATIRRQEAQVAAQRASARSARATRWPTLSMSFGFFQNAYAQESGALFKAFPDQGRYFSTDLRVSIPVFSRFQNESQIAQAEVSVLNAEETIRLNRLQVEQDIRSQLIDLQRAYDDLQLADRSSQIAAERLRLAREEYRLASRSFTELQQAIEEEANERRGAVDARYAFIDARITLEETVGGPIGAPR